MVRDETVEFVRNNRSLLRELARNGDPAIRPLAAAFLAAVPPGKCEGAQEPEPSRGEGSPDGSENDSEVVLVE